MLKIQPRWRIAISLACMLPNANLLQRLQKCKEASACWRALLKVLHILGGEGSQIFSPYYY